MSNSEWSERQLLIITTLADSATLERIAFLTGRSQSQVIKKMEEMGLRKRAVKKGAKPKITRPPAIYSNKSYHNGQQ